MIWNHCFAISAALFLAAIFAAIFAACNRKRRCVYTPLNIMFIGVFASIFVAQLPLFEAMFSGGAGYSVKVIVADFLQTIQIFTLNTGAGEIITEIDHAGFDLCGLYSVYVTVLFCIAPVLTFGFILSFLKTLASSFRYITHYYADAYIFSQLNEKSLTLAQSIKENHRNSIIVFTGVIPEADSDINERIERAYEMNAIVTRKDFTSSFFLRHGKKAQMNLFVINESEDTNLSYALGILEKYSCRDKTGLYVFSTEEDGEIILANAEKGKIKLRRINEVRSLIYNYLYENGKEIFESAIETKNGKNINAVILGLGRYGTELLKALAWFGQMDGYKLRIDVFDLHEDAESKFTSLCPELMSDKLNGTFKTGEGQYDIRIHSGIDVNDRDYITAASTLPETTFAFVSLGDDTANIKHAVKIRMLCERKGTKPIIRAVVYDENKKSALETAKNYSGQKYGVGIVGSLKSSYSEKIIIGTELEKLALERHLKWGNEEAFWRYEYNYRSSMASAIHRKARIECGVQPKEENHTEEEKVKLECLEHRRWNTYMRTEGYIYSGSSDRNSKNDLAKVHHNLTGYESLKEHDKRKDSSVGI